MNLLRVFCNALWQSLSQLYKKCDKEYQKFTIQTFDFMVFSIYQAVVSAQLLHSEYLASYLSILAFFVTELVFTITQLFSMLFPTILYL